MKQTSFTSLKFIQYKHIQVHNPPFHAMLNRVVLAKKEKLQKKSIVDKMTTKTKNSNKKLAKKLKTKQLNI